jgi:hypothetical protein
LDQIAVDQLDRCEHDGQPAFVGDFQDSALTSELVLYRKVAVS